MMIFLRLSLAAAALSLSSCVVTTAPEPADFKLSHEALSHKYPAARRAGTVHLYAQKIDTTRDQWGRETHLATGGALLVKESHPPIFAEAASISVTPEFSEVSGRSTVKRDDRLYVGKDESATIRIDGTAIIPDGPVATRGVAAAASAPPAPAATAEKTATAPLPAPEEAGAPQIAPSAPKPKPVPKKPKIAASKPRPKPASSASSAASAKPAPAAKTAAPQAQPAAAPAAQPKKAPAANKSDLLNLMREPTDR